MSVTNVEDADRSTRLLSQTTLRNILGTKTLAEILSDREHVAQNMQVGREQNAVLKKKLKKVRKKENEIDRKKERMKEKKEKEKSMKKYTE